MDPKKLALSAIVLVAAVLGLWWFLSGETAVPPAPGRVETTEAAAGALATGEVESPAGFDDFGQREAAPVDPPADAPAQPSPEELWGRVVSAATGEPVGGADLTLLHRDADEFWNLDLEYGKRIVEVGRTRSAADGTFAFAVPRAKTHKLVVRAGGYAGRTLPDLLGGSFVLVELAAGATVTGVVRCEGEPLGDVPVRVAVAGESIELAVGRTAQDGTFLFPNLQPATVYVQALSPDHSEQWQRLVLEAGGTHRAEFDLEAGGTVRGRVVDDPTGTPIVGAELSDSWTFKRLVRTGDDGRFALRGIDDDGAIILYARAAGFTSASRNVSGELDQEIVLRLVRGGTVTGRVVGEGGVGVPGAYVAVGASYMEAPGLGGCDWRRAEVDGEGRFSARGLRADLHYWLYLRASGCGTRVYALARRLDNGERIDVGDVVLRTAGGIEGRVVDDRGQPLAGVRVSVDGTNADSGRWLGGPRPETVLHFERRDGRTDAAGVFRFTGLSAGSYRVSARPPGHRDAVSEEVTVADGAIAADVELVVELGLTITGRLSYTDGRSPGDEAAELSLMAEREGQSSTHARVEQGGRFVFRGLEAGAYTLTMLRGPAGWVMEPRPGVAAGTTGLDLLLEQAAAITGQVVGPDGVGRKAHVYAERDGAHGGSALHPTDEEGRFRIEVPPSFRGTVGAMGLGSWVNTARVENVTAGATDLRLELRR